MKIFCRVYEKWLLPYALGELDKCEPKTASSVARHVDECESCRQRISEMVAFDATLRRRTARASLPETPPSPAEWIERSRASSEMVQRVMAQIEPEVHVTPAYRWAPGVATFVGLAIVAAACIVLADPQSAARAWLAETFMAAPIVSHAPLRPAPAPPYSASTDPFKPSVAPQLLDTSKPRVTTVPLATPSVSIVRLGGSSPSIARQQPVIPQARPSSPALAPQILPPHEAGNGALQPAPPILPDPSADVPHEHQGDDLGGIQGEDTIDSKLPSHP